MTTATETTTRVRVYATGSCEGFDKLRDSLGSHPEIELVGASSSVDSPRPSAGNAPA